MKGPILTLVAPLNSGFSLFRDIFLSIHIFLTCLEIGCQDCLLSGLFVSYFVNNILIDLLIYLSVYKWFKKIIRPLNYLSNYV